MLAVNLYVVFAVFSIVFRSHVLFLRVRFNYTDELFALAILYVNKTPLQIATAILRSKHRLQ